MHLAMTKKVPPLRLASLGSGRDDGVKSLRALIRPRPDARDLDQRPRIGELADRAVDQGRAAARQAAGDRGAELGRRGHALGGDAEAVAELHEVRVAEVAGDGAVVERLL